MLQSFGLVLRPRLRAPSGRLTAFLGALSRTFQARRRRRAALENWAALRSMSDRELADLAIGRGERTRDAGPAAGA